MHGVTIRFTPNDRGNPPGKLADGELHFTSPIDLGQAAQTIINLRTLAARLDKDDASKYAAIDCYSAAAQLEALCALAPASVLDGLKLIGFAVWERRTSTGRNVVFPARQYSVNGERRSFSLLRPVVDSGAQDRLRAFILDAYEKWAAEQGQSIAAK